MRIKVSILNNRNLRDINVQKIKLSNKFGENQPRIYFKCHKKYETLLKWGVLVFHDKKGKELFRSSNVRVDFRYYELDPWNRQEKVRFVADLIEFEDMGPVSSHYLLKILKGACNSKLSKISEKTNENNNNDDYERIMKLLRKVGFERIRMKVLMKFMLIFPKYGLLIEHIFRQVFHKSIKNAMESRAPT